jgi:hypothetical protein
MAPVAFVLSMLLKLWYLCPRKIEIMASLNTFLPNAKAIAKFHNGFNLREPLLKHVLKIFFIWM